MLNAIDCGAKNEPLLTESKGWSSYEGDTVNMLGLKDSLLLWAPSKEPNNHFEKMLLLLRSIENCNQEMFFFEKEYQDNIRLQV